MRTLILLALAGCSYDENLPEVDITGKVVLPKEAATRTVLQYTGVDADGDGNEDFVESEVTDVRLIGPVILGAFAGIDTTSFDYPHPSMGPIIETATPGDTFPYGGTTIGRLDYACYEALRCKISTGRFTSYDDVLSYFRDYMGYPVRDNDGNFIDESSTFQQECLELFEFTSDEELDFISPTLDFVETDEGWEADFVLPHTVMVPGMVIWGWMDAPAIEPYEPDRNGTFTTCNAESGNLWTEYDESYYWGRFYTNTLNFPSQYIFDGDWIADGTTVVNAETDQPVVNLNVHYSEEGE